MHFVTKSCLYFWNLYTKRKAFLTPSMTHPAYLGPDQHDHTMSNGVRGVAFYWQKLFFEISFLLVLNISSGMSFSCTVVTIDGGYYTLQYTVAHEIVGEIMK
jgi:hypothetical protein